MQSTDAKRELVAALEERARRQRALAEGRCVACGAQNFTHVLNEWFNEDGSPNLGDAYNDHRGCTLARTHRRCNACGRLNVFDITIERISDGPRAEKCVGLEPLVRLRAFGSEPQAPPTAGVVIRVE